MFPPKRTAQRKFAKRIVGCHSTHNSVPSRVWIRKRKEKELKANPGRRRLNINGALNIKNCEMEVVYLESVNGQSTIELFNKIESLHPDAKRIAVVADAARYYHSKLIREYLKTSRINLVFLPPNLIERCWKPSRIKPQIFILRDL